MVSAIQYRIERHAQQRHEALVHAGVEQAQVVPASRTKNTKPSQEHGHKQSGSTLRLLTPALQTASNTSRQLGRRLAYQSKGRPARCLKTWPAIENSSFTSACHALQAATHEHVELTTASRDSWRELRTGGSVAIKNDEQHRVWHQQTGELRTNPGREAMMDRLINGP